MLHFINMQCNASRYILFISQQLFANKNSHASRLLFCVRRKNKKEKQRKYLRVQVIFWDHIFIEAWIFLEISFVHLVGFVDEQDDFVSISICSFSKCMIHAPAVIVRFRDVRCWETENKELHNTAPDIKVKAPENSACINMNYLPSGNMPFVKNFLVIILVILYLAHSTRAGNAIVADNYYDFVPIFEGTLNNNSPPLSWTSDCYFQNSLSFGVLTSQSATVPSANNLISSHYYIENFKYVFQIFLTSVNRSSPLCVDYYIFATREQFRFHPVLLVKIKFN